MAMKNYVAYNAFTPKIQIIRIHAFVEFQKLIFSKGSLLCAINADAEVAAVLTD